MCTYIMQCVCVCVFYLTLIHTHTLLILMCTLSWRVSGIHLLILTDVPVYFPTQNQGVLTEPTSTKVQLSSNISALSSEKDIKMNNKQKKKSTMQAFRHTYSITYLQRLLLYHSEHLSVKKSVCIYACVCVCV